MASDMRVYSYCDGPHAGRASISATFGPNGTLQVVGRFCFVSKPRPSILRAPPEQKIPSEVD